MHFFIVVILVESRQILVVPHYWIQDLSEQDYFIGGAKRYIEQILFCHKEYPTKNIDKIVVPVQCENKSFAVFILKGFGEKTKLYKT